MAKSSKKSLRILVTGGAGYIGSVLVPVLLETGHKVIVIDNFMYAQSSLLDVCLNPHLTVIRGDARDERLMASLLKNAEYILPLACLTGAPACDRDPGTAQSVNVAAIRFLLKQKSKNQRIIFPTTNSGYGIGQKGIYCDEKTPLRPISLYGRLKAEAEAMILSAGNSITLRLATAFGVSPRMRLDLLVNDFTYRAVTDGFVVLFEEHFVRNYIHVRDIARAFLHALSHFEAMKGEPYNVGLSDCNLTKRQLCEEIKRYVPRFAILFSSTGKDPDQRNYLVSNAKIEAAGFKPRLSLQDGIQELLKGFQIVRRNQFANV